MESAVSKSAYISQGQKLKVTNSVRHQLDLDMPPMPLTTNLTQVNPDIVGGLVVEIGDRTIDLSVSARIAKMNKLLTDSL